MRDEPAPRDKGSRFGVCGALRLASCVALGRNAMFIMSGHTVPGRARTVMVFLKFSQNLYRLSWVLLDGERRKLGTCISQGCAASSS